MIADFVTQMLTLVYLAGPDHEQLCHNHRQSRPLSIHRPPALSCQGRRKASANNIVTAILKKPSLPSQITNIGLFLQPYFKKYPYLGMLRSNHYEAIGIQI